MSPLFILSALSGTGAIIVLILLLLVAGVIGYITAWYYAKSVYTPIIKGLEEEKEELNRQILGLKDDVSKLNGKVTNLSEAIGKLEKELTEKDKEIITLKKPKKTK